MSLLKYFAKVKKCYTLISLVAFAFLTGCNTHEKKPVKVKYNKEIKVDTTTAVAAPILASADTMKPIDCPRGAAGPVVKKSIFPGAHFALQADGITGIETLTLPQGDKVTIKQSGCEYYILNVEIETSRFAADTTDINYWYTAALTLMRELNSGLNTPLEINKGLNKLAGRIKAGQAGTQNQLKLNDEIDFGGPDPRQYLTVDHISQIVDHGYLVNLTFSYGPI
ncbi:hypothetical protein [Mucilaginibacter polytrichastri]|uniref:Uncharacterized protein n=1 Tax=Mucilaginibacter polytrichastri TaxID=1302689 RepID=A0A1Q6A0D3_9SPHI|nr:hypothetical protein [Mucilaginibacter polytrichastri]OKS87458.1 hypothetical protein RG47T_2919 [Mucilaginibacter polytrichastri]SFS90885.1 hypothetical protein SAMN04487890_10653 [Mucilaginibacter polytrichastri]